MEKVLLNVDGMTCSHCENRVKKVVGALTGVKGVTVDLAGKKVEIEYDSSLLSLKEMKDAIEDQGYDVQ